jgi:hypothetical protein
MTTMHKHKWNGGVSCAICGTTKGREARRLDNRRLIRRAEVAEHALAHLAFRRHGFSGGCDGCLDICHVLGTGPI